MRAAQCFLQSSAFTADATQERQCPPSSPNAADTGSSMILAASPSYHHDASM
ncbi:hypothetical protein K523DRAFT_356682 [Schizophyllum commune Tattone D]|nr:hypothetical protein K523DRAFT_356682 [Schizophyllum commune Tattone D]